MAQRNGKRCFWGLVALLSLFGWATAIRAQEEAPSRAKIGIQIRSGDQDRKARARDRVRTGDLLRIYVLPEKAACVYIVHSDLNKATLLNACVQKIRTGAIVVPSSSEYYKVDGKSDRERITVICSPTPVQEIESFGSEGTISHPQWAAVEAKLAEKGRIDLESAPTGAISLAGNVRGAESAATAEMFMEGLPTYSGKNILVKTYAFTVQK